MGQKKNRFLAKFIIKITLLLEIQIDVFFRLAKNSDLSSKKGKNQAIDKDFESSDDFGKHQNWEKLGNPD